MKVTALIMAGGKGERFWPRSRVSLPKQFLNITDENRTMIQLTVERILPVVDAEDIFVLTNKAYESLVKEQLCEKTNNPIPLQNILFEPCSKNTAPAISLGASHIQKKYNDSVMLVLPSDSLILKNDNFLTVLKKAIQVAEIDSNIVTVGITPTSPETGYGYINYKKEESCGIEGVHEVIRYVEKPNAKTAQEYLDAGTYLWNSGQFIMKCSVLLDSVKKYANDVFAPISKIASSIGTKEYEKVLHEEFVKCNSISIDYAVMEKSKSMFTVEGDLGWDDVGSWNSLNRIKDCDKNENTFTGNAVVLDCNNCIIEGKDKLIAAIGLEDIIVVDTEDVLLLCKKDQAQNIKKVLEILKNDNKEQYL